jgi:outer membrane protein TolC
MRITGVLLFLVALPAGALDWSDPRLVAEEAVRKSSTLARLEREVAAARERVESAGALPNPMAMAGISNQEIDLSDDPMMTMYMVGASQTFISGSKRAAMRNAALHDVRVVEQELRIARAQTERDALTSWYDAASATSRLQTATELRLLVDAIIDAARVRYEVGSAIQADVIRAQLERSRLDHQILMLERERETAIARLLPMLDLSPDTAVPPFRLEHHTTPSNPDLSLELPADHPALLALQAEIERAGEMVRLARLAERPDFSIEASYGLRRERSDMFSVVATIELPVRRDVIDPAIRDAIARREAAVHRLEEVRRQIATSLALARTVRTQAHQQLRLHEEVLVPQARMAFESTLTSYQTGAASFDAVLAAESAYAALQLDYYEFLTEFLRAQVDYEAVRGGAL